MPDASFRIVPVDATNAHHVATVFRSVYGEDYPVRDVYQPDTLIKVTGSGELSSLLAFDMDGRAAGYASMYRAAPNPRLWEAGNLVVVPEYSKTDISFRLIRSCFNLASQMTDNTDGVFGEAVCSHYFTQINAVKNGMIDCALELDQLDGESFKDGKSNPSCAARVSCIFTFLETTDPPEPEYIPLQYDDILRLIARSLRPRTFLPSTATLPSGGSTIIEEKHYPSARTWKVSVPTVGSDWKTTVISMLNEARERRVVSLQVRINMSSPHIGAAVEVLRSNGFFFGGMAPRWFGTDGLFMQKLFGSKTEYDEIKLYTQTAKELLSFIRSDRDAVHG